MSSLKGRKTVRQKTPVPVTKRLAAPSQNPAPSNNQQPARETPEARNDALNQMRDILKTEAQDAKALHQKEGGIPIKDFIRAVFNDHEHLYNEYNELLAERDNTDDLFTAFKANPKANRYVDIKCLDSSRVILKNSPTGTNYIHANYVDGYRIRKKFICTQGPLHATSANPGTYSDFWHMIWQEGCQVICMTTKTIEQGKNKCGQYWPETSNTSQTYGPYQVNNKSVNHQGSYMYTELLLKCTGVKQARPIIHLLYLAWPDCGVPMNSNVFLSYMECMRFCQLQFANPKGKQSTRPAGPIVVHCSAGIGRTGTLCAVDIAIMKILDTGIVDLMPLVRRIRTQRIQAVQKPEQYVFVALTIIQFALGTGIIPMNTDNVTKYHKVQKEADQSLASEANGPANVPECEYAIPVKAVRRKNQEKRE